jgi:uncharacterized protein involved in type VI secretion and phage assembly
MADAGNFGGSVPEHKRHTVLLQPQSGDCLFFLRTREVKMSLKGLRFTLNIDGLEETSTAVVGFTLQQCHSTPFALDVDIASDLPDLTATDFLEKNAVLTVWQGMEAQRYVNGIINEVTLGKIITGRCAITSQ